VNELTLMLVRFGYLAILWIFVLSAVSVVRSDIFGARVETSRADRRSERKADRQAAKQARQSEKGRKPGRTPRGAPTKVVITEGANAGEQIGLDLAPLLIGRGNDAQIRLDDDYVSTRHARIASTGDTWYVEDLGSTNGTYLGTHRITQPTTLQAGARLRVGKTTLELKK
jgi:pSer/pThr/pTyr-binding forkhead associated (FHA) protein